MMISFTTRLAQQAFDRVRSRLLGESLACLRAQALFAGGLLGAVVAGLAAAAAQTGEPAFRLAMALVMVVAGVTSFWLYASQSRVARGAEPRMCLCLLGAAVIASTRVCSGLLG